MILRTRHTGLVVRDINASIAFYEAMGLSVWKRQVEEGPFISGVVGVPDVVIETAKLKASDGTLVELLQYHSHPDSQTFSRAASNKLGCSHIAFTVEDLEAACALIVAQGGSVINAPGISPDGNVKVSYCHDLDGILLEMVEEIKAS